MSWVEDPSWDLPPIDWPNLDLETAYWAAERAAALAPDRPRLASPEEGWAVPGVFENHPPPGRPGPSAELTALGLAVDGLEQAKPAADPVQALADLGELLRIDEQLRVARLTRLTDAHVRKLAQLDDEVSVQTWARHRYDDVPRADIKTSALLTPFVHLRGQVAAHLVTVAASDLVGKALKKLRPHLDRDDGLIDGQPAAEVIPAVVANIVRLISSARLGLRDDDPLLAELLAKVEEILAAPDSDLGKLEIAFSLMARYIPLRHLPGALAEQVDALLPTELEEKSERSRQTRDMRLDRERAFGGGRITVQATDELMELAETVLAAEVRRDPENPADTEAKREHRQRSLHGDVLDPDPEGDGDVRFPRSRGQRLHDALLLVLQRYLAHGLAGTHNKAPVTVTVTLPIENLEKRPGALPAKSGNGRRLPVSLVGRWWCDASVTALVLNQGMIPLGITHEMRTIGGVERKASLIQHGRSCDGLRCCSPDDPLVTLVPHHLRSFAKFGKTSIEETIWACPRLHDAIHRGKTVPLRNGRWINADGDTSPPLTLNY